eukprot:scaffold56129_cov69-Phaeocystis_antarctica.AAC.7
MHTACALRAHCMHTACALHTINYHACKPHAHCTHQGLRLTAEDHLADRGVSGHVGHQGADGASLTTSPNHLALALNLALALAQALT